jgi:hypothetical protein
LSCRAAWSALIRFIILGFLATPLSPENMVSSNRGIAAGRWKETACAVYIIIEGQHCERHPDGQGIVLPVAAIKGAVRTGQLGDGKIFVTPLEHAVDIRTDETDFSDDLVAAAWMFDLLGQSQRAI